MDVDDTNMEPSSVPTQPTQEGNGISNEVQAMIDGWLNGTITSKDAIQDKGHPFYVHSNNKEGFKYKYPEAQPTPDGEDDVVWNRTYTAADSRNYNRLNKDSNQSKKVRATGQTWTECVRIHLENKQKFAKKYTNAFDLSSIKDVKAAPKPKPASSRPTYYTTTETMSQRNDEMGEEMSNMSITEKVKSQQGKRKASTNAALALGSSSSSSEPFQFTAGPSSASPSVAGPSTTSSNAVQPPRASTPKPKKKGTAAKKVKKAAPAAGSSKVTHGVQATRSRASTMESSDSDGDDNQYCICRGKDDHRMMVFCDGPCKEWYHCQCIGVNEKDAEELLDVYYCPKCTIPDVKYTTWKRMCRYYNIDNTHRIAARVNQLSKYCSDECIVKFWTHIRSTLRKDGAPSLGGPINQKEFDMMILANPNHEAFHAMGMKPTLPVPEGRDPNRPIGLDYVTKEEQEELDNIKILKEELQVRIDSHKDQMKLLTMVQERLKNAIKHHPSLDSSICGFDSRLDFNEFEFRRWMETDEAKKAFDTGKLGPRAAPTKAMQNIVTFPGQVVAPSVIVPDLMNNVCTKKAKACRHTRFWVETHRNLFVTAIKNLQIEMDVHTEREDFIVADAEEREVMKEYNAHNTVTRLF